MIAMDWMNALASRATGACMMTNPSETVTALLTLCATIGAIRLPRHSRKMQNEVARPINTGAKRSPCGWMAAKIALEMSAAHANAAKAP